MYYDTVQYTTLHYVTLRYVTIIMEADDDEHITRTTSYRQASKQITDRDCCGTGIINQDIMK